MVGNFLEVFELQPVISQNSTGSFVINWQLSLIIESDRMSVGTISQNPSVSKSHRLHVGIFSVFSSILD